MNSHNSEVKNLIYIKNISARINKLQFSRRKWQSAFTETKQ